MIFLSEGHRSDMLLDLSGLTREERVMIHVDDAVIDGKFDIQAFAVPSVSTADSKVFERSRNVRADRV